jgi:hypothetical protein
VFRWERLDHRAHRMALRAMLIDLERLLARSCRQSDDGGFSAAATHFHTPKPNLFVIRPFASPINECDFAGYCLTATSMSFGSTPAIKPKSRSRCRSGMLA